MFQESCTEDFALRTAETVQSSTVSQFPCINKALKAFHVRSLVQFKGRGAMRLGWSTAGNPIRFGEGFCRLKKSLCNAPKASEGAGSIWKYHVPKTLGDVIRKTWKF